MSDPQHPAMPPDTKPLEQEPQLSPDLTSNQLQLNTEIGPQTEIPQTSVPLSPSDTKPITSPVSQPTVTTKITGDKVSSLARSIKAIEFKNKLKVGSFLVTGLVIVVGLGVGVVTFTSKNQSDKNAQIPPESSSVPEATIQPSGSSGGDDNAQLTQYSYQGVAVDADGLYRQPTQGVTSSTSVVKIRANVQQNNTAFSGKFVSIWAEVGSPLQNNSQYQTITQPVLKIVYKDLENTEIEAVPIPIGDPLYGLKSKFAEPTDIEIVTAVPVQTNSVEMINSLGEVLDKVYIEEWQPDAILEVIPRALSRFEKLEYEAQLIPDNIPMKYRLDFVSVDSNQRFNIINSLFSTTNKINSDLDITISPASLNDVAWYVDLALISSFQTKRISSNEFLINHADYADPVRIASSTTDYEAQRKAQFFWVGSPELDVNLHTGWREYCEKSGFCFEFIWTGRGLDFITIDESGQEVRAKSLVSQVNNIVCTFNNVGIKNLILEVILNGESLGTETLETEILQGVPGEPVDSCREAS